MCKLRFRFTIVEVLISMQVQFHIDFYLLFIILSHGSTVFIIFICLTFRIRYGQVHSPFDRVQSGGGGAGADDLTSAKFARPP
jgi:hypothetical protein